MGDVERAVGLFHSALVNVDAILVLKGSVGALPSSDTATAATQLDRG